jgi:hypothetical protein
MGDSSFQTLGSRRWGVKLLGGIASRDKLFIKRVTMKRVVRVVELMRLLPDLLQDLHSEFLLLRSYMHIANLFRFKDVSTNSHGWCNYFV